MSEDNSSSDNNNIRRSRRIAAKVDEPKSLSEAMVDDLELLDEDSQTGIATTSKKNVGLTQTKRKIYRSTGKSKSESTGTLFDQGLVAVRILGATTIHDDAKGTDDICYLVKYNNGQFELVLNTVAHKCCPMLLIDFLESNIAFNEKSDQDLPSELMGDDVSSQLDQLSDINDSQLGPITTHSESQSSNRSIEI